MLEFFATWLLISKKLSILVVDDDAAMRNIISTVLNTLDFQLVHTKDNAKSGFALFQQYRHDIIITDWQMPGMDGVEPWRLHLDY